MDTQGQSWPDEVDGLTFSAELWAEQIEDFLSQHIREPAFLVGNSLGVRNEPASHPRCERPAGN